MGVLKAPLRQELGLCRRQPTLPARHLRCLPAQELRAALLTDEPGAGAAAFVGCGQAWRVALEACLAGRGSHHSLVGAWEELKAAIRAWLDIRDPPGLGLGPGAALLQPGSPAAALHGPGAARAVAAMAAAAEEGEAAVLQARRRGGALEGRGGLAPG